MEECATINNMRAHCITQIDRCRLTILCQANSGIWKCVFLFIYVMGRENIGRFDFFSAPHHSIAIDKYNYYLYTFVRCEFRNTSVMYDLSLGVYCLPSSRSRAYHMHIIAFPKLKGKLERSSSRLRKRKWSKPNRAHHTLSQRA